jgi:uncharacterized protein involved in type VI secretion and phage assembly
MSERTRTFYGKYRGVVTAIDDPFHKGRVRARVPDVFGLIRVSGWAEPATPYAGPGVGLYLVPPVGASVWIEFEHGDPDFPIWSGCFWANEGDVPAEADDPKVKVLKTDSATITLDDLAEAITITTDNSQITLLKDSIVIQHQHSAAIKLAGPTVSINQDALEVT